MTTDYIDVVFDGPPGHESGRFVEVEDAAGKSIRRGEWVRRGDGLWALRFHGCNDPKWTTANVAIITSGPRTVA